MTILGNPSLLVKTGYTTGIRGQYWEVKDKK